MSTDFTTGKNKEISKDSLYLMKCDIMGRLLNVNREDLYEFYKNRGECNGNGKWEYYERYTKIVNSNDYTNNKLDDLIVLSAAIDKQEFLDKNINTIEQRRNSLKEICSNIINERKCNDFKSSLTNLIPHLDTPDEIINLDSLSGGIPCEEMGYDVITPIITYTDSCGCNIKEPIPEYPIDNQDVIFQKKGNDIRYMTEGAEFNWEIKTNNDQIRISPETESMKESYIEIAVLSTALSSSTDIKINVTYSE